MRHPIRAAFVGATPLRTAACLLLFAGISALRAAAVSVSPVAVYIDHRTRQGTLTLFNPGDRPEEVQIEFGFGYPISDADGNVTVPVTKESPLGEPSAAPWLRAFPRRVLLEPGQKQVVRVLADPPPDLPEGEYWARALVRSRGGQPPLEEQRGDVAIQIDVETVVVIAVNYRNGGVHTGLRVETARAWLEGDSIQARVDLQREGNAAFLGRLLVEYVDSDGRVLDSTDEVLAVYRDLRRVVSAPASGLTGVARVRFTMDTLRDDLPAGGALPVEPLTVEVPLG